MPARSPGRRFPPAGLASLQTAIGDAVNLAVRLRRPEARTPYMARFLLARLHGEEPPTVDCTPSDERPATTEEEMW